MKKFISVALCLVLAFSALSLCAFAAANGDLTGDNKIKTEDARKILRVAVGLETLTPEQLVAADIDMDGKVTTTDARLALRIAVDLEKTDGKLYKDEFEIFKSGFFFIDMDVVTAEGSQNTKMAITDKSTYLSMNFDAGDMFGDDFGFANMGNINISILVNEKDTYFIDENSKTYAPMSALFKFAGGDLSEDDFTGAFTDMDMGVDVDLADANKTVTESFNGVSCKKYVFNASDGSSTNVYMNGKKLVAITFETPNGKEDTQYVFNSITLTVPMSYTAPSSSYKAVDPLEMLAGMLIGGNLGSLFG